jgi:dTDP-4-dehydrorhamnose 3,5-epimerase
MPEPLRPDDLSPRFAAALTTQSYAPRPRIDGVQILDLRLMIDDGGSFAELVRFDSSGRLIYPKGNPEIDFSVRQSSYSQVLPGAIKAFHLHYNQEDLWFVPPTDRLLIGLIDCRDGSPTLDNTMRFVLGAGKAQLLYIPRGVAHGCANIGETSSTILYDERRLPWDIVGADFWEMVAG